MIRSLIKDAGHRFKTFFTTCLPNLRPRRRRHARTNDAHKPNFEPPANRAQVASLSASTQRVPNNFVVVVQPPSSPNPDNFSRPTSMDFDAGGDSHELSPRQDPPSRLSEYTKTPRCTQNTDLHLHSASECPAAVGLDCQDASNTPAESSGQPKCSDERQPRSRALLVRGR